MQLRKAFRCCSKICIDKIKQQKYNGCTNAHSTLNKDTINTTSKIYHAKGVIPIIAIDLRNPKPIYEQIKDNIKELIITGAFKQDEQLPSIRELAQSTSINPNTIQKAYRDLESEGFIYTVTGRGNFVAPPPKKLDSGRIEKLYKILKETVGELSYLGDSENNIINVVKSAISHSAT